MFSLSPFSYRAVTVAVCNLSGEMPHSNDTFCLCVSVSFINFICSLTTRFGTLSLSTERFHLRCFVVISTLSSDKDIKNLRILFLNIFLSLTVPFVCLSFTATFFSYFISCPFYLLPIFNKPVIFSCLCFPYCFSICASVIFCII